MPTMVHSFQDGELDSIYMQPPMLYPDGKHYLKLGHGKNFEQQVRTLEELNAWYEANGGGVPEAVAQLERRAKKLIPGVVFKSVKGGACVTANVRIYRIFTQSFRLRGRGPCR